MEVFPPAFPYGGRRRLGLEGKVEDFVRTSRKVTGVADLFLVAAVRSPSSALMSTVQGAILLGDRLGVDASPTIVVRRTEKAQVRSSIATSLAMGLSSVTLVWGDRTPEAGVSRDCAYPSLSDAIADAAAFARKHGARLRILAPVDLSALDSERGVALALGRIRAGADFLLAQPPTTDSGPTFERHFALLRRAGVRGKVLLSVFPFMGEEDVQRVEGSFGWALPQSLHTLSRSGRGALIREARQTFLRISSSPLPGVYVSTRGDPSAALRILGEDRA